MGRDIRGESGEVAEDEVERDSENEEEEIEQERQRDLDRMVEESLHKVAKAEELAMESRTDKPAAGGSMHGLSIEKRISVGKHVSPQSAIKTTKELSFKLAGRTFSIRKKVLLLMILNSVLVAAILSVNYIIFRDAMSIFSSINLIALFIFIFPIVMIKYGQYKRRKEIEELFPVFLRDFVEAIRGGMTVPYALKSVSRNDYRALTPHVKKMAVQLDWGVPVERVLELFSNKVKSKIISRIISSVRESHRFGGSLADTLEALSNTAVEVERLREERRLYLHSQMITGYIIFFVFLAVIIALETFLVPTFSEMSGTAFLTGGAASASISAEEGAKNAEQFKMIFQNLILIQGFFAGLAVGKMAEGAIVAGIKHSMFMMFIGTLVFTIAA